MVQRPLAPGTVLSGRYQIVEAIGESQLGAVYAASDLRGQTQVALKAFEPSVATRAAALSEYQAQARLASGLGVEGIARAYDFGIDANSGLAFSTTERVSWPSLDRRVLAQGPLGASDLNRALGVLSRALDAAHRSALVHRDLKPQNVFISADNPEWVRITDFGLSALRRQAPEAMGWGGPPGYTAPEAVDAAAPSAPAMDVFALGMLVFFALTRGSPFRSLRNPGFDPNAHWTELNQALHPISERAKELGVALDPAFDAWFARALSPAPHERFRSAGEMAREFSVLAEAVSARGGGGPKAMPGIAAAIAQPLVFQPEPSPASLGLAATHPATPTPLTGPRPTPAAEADRARAAQPSRPSSLSDDERAAGLPRRRSKLPLLIALGVLLLGGIALAGYGLFVKRAPDTPEPEPSATASASAAPQAPASAPAPSAPAPSAAAGPARARFSCKPEKCEWVVCDGQPLKGFEQALELSPGAHECSASKYGFGSKSLSVTLKPGELTEVVFELPALPAETQKKAAAAPAPQPRPAAKDAAKPADKDTAKKPAVKDAAKKPAVKDTKKKKCGTFLGCK